MKLKNLFLAFLIISAFGCKNTKEKSPETEEITTVSQLAPSIDIQPISHATMVLDWEGTILYFDPVGGEEAFAGKKDANIIFVTDIHGDHLNLETLVAVSKENSQIIAPKAVIDQLPENLKKRVTQLDNDQTIEKDGFTITGIPMYNLREEALQFHEKGRGNGYLIEKDDYRVYISGDTEDIPEMRNLKNIDLAFVCMNLPFTMTVESAASAVADFKPTTVIPYHYRGREGFANVDAFEKMVNELAPEVNVKRIDFYPEN
tara:strand:- start:20026 stop:20805 length:780 start_codon:yes stop_codon:yes gene_type:complete